MCKNFICFDLLEHYQLSTNPSSGLCENKLRNKGLPKGVVDKHEQVIFSSQNGTLNLKGIRYSDSNKSRLELHEGTTEECVSIRSK